MVSSSSADVRTQHRSPNAGAGNKQTWVNDTGNFHGFRRCILAEEAEALVKKLADHLGLRLALLSHMEGIQDSL